MVGPWEGGKKRKATQQITQVIMLLGPQRTERLQSSMKENIALLPATARPIQQQVAFARIAGDRCGSLKLSPGLFHASKFL